jgi:hypothetical protein
MRPKSLPAGAEEIGAFLLPGSYVERHENQLRSLSRRAASLKLLIDPEQDKSADN